MCSFVCVCVRAWCVAIDYYYAVDFISYTLKVRIIENVGHIHSPVANLILIHRACLLLLFPPPPSPLAIVSIRRSSSSTFIVIFYCSENIYIYIYLKVCTYNIAIEISPIARRIQCIFFLFFSFVHFAVTLSHLFREILTLTLEFPGKTIGIWIK